MDLYYIQNYSVMLDVKLMIQTVKILFMKESTEGIGVEQTTALEPEEVYERVRRRAE